MVCGLDAALGARRGHAGVFLPGQSTMTTRFLTLAARGESPASHRGRRGAPLTRRDDRAYREYVSEEQRSQRGCIAGRMQAGFHRGLPGVSMSDERDTKQKRTPSKAPARGKLPYQKPAFRHE